MPLFTKFIKAKEAAVEHQKTASNHQSASARTPYKHIPTHAAQDALASSPSTLRPEELKARIASARKRRASSYDPSLLARRAVYHSCESSRNPSRANSPASSSCASTASSFKGKAALYDSIDFVASRPQTLAHRHSMPAASKRHQRNDQASPLPGGLPYPPTFTHRPRPHQSTSRRSSFTKKKSPLSNVSVEEGSGVVSQSGSISSTGSSQSMESESSVEIDDKAPATMNPSNAMPSQPTSRPSHTSRQLQVGGKVPRPKSMWSFFPRKSVGVAAH